MIQKGKVQDWADHLLTREIKLDYCRHPSQNSWQFIPMNSIKSITMMVTILIIVIMMIKNMMRICYNQEERIVKSIT